MKTSKVGIVAVAILVVVAIARTSTAAPPGEVQPQAVEQIQPPAYIRSMEARVKQLEVEVEKLRAAVESHILAFSKHTHGINLGELDIKYVEVKGIYPETLLGEDYLVPLCILQPCLGRDTLPPR